MIKTRVSEIVVTRGKSNKSRLAKELGMNRWSVIHLLENDTPERMDLKTIEKLCKTLNIMPNDLFIITNEDGTVWSPDRLSSGGLDVSNIKSIEMKNQSPSENVQSTGRTSRQTDEVDK